MAGVYPKTKTGRLTALAPAKLNLTLEVLGRRPDGFHEIRSIVQTISLCDTLHFQLSQETEFRCDRTDWIAELSLVSRAVSLVRETTGCSNGVRIEVSKHIPMLSGLGGDSSGAATTLWGLNKLWGLGLAPAKLLELAGQLGSDVAFFLYGGAALLSGRGEVVTPLPVLPHRWVVLAVPPISRQLGKTARLYASLAANHYTDGQVTDELVDELRRSGESAPSVLFNTFENVAFAWPSEMSGYREHLLKVGMASVHLAGSGPALFTLLKDESQAEELYACVRQHGWECYLAETLVAIDLIK